MSLSRLREPPEDLFSGLIEILKGGNKPKPSIVLILMDEGVDLDKIRACRRIRCEAEQFNLDNSPKLSMFIIPIYQSLHSSFPKS